MVQQVAVPHTGGNHGVFDLHTIGLLWIKRALRDLMIIINAVHAGKSITRQRTLQWKAIMQRMHHHSEAVQIVVDSAAGWLWGFRLRSVTLLNYYSQHAVVVLKEWAILADGQATQRTIENARGAARRWWQWVDDQLRAGAGALHSFCKRDERLRDAPQLVGAALPTLGIQALLDSDRETWRKVWEKFADTASAPWTKACLCPWAGELPPISGAEVAAAGRKFNRHTGLGGDSFRPQWFSWLSEELLDQYARLLMIIEILGCWPQLVSVLLIAQIPKPDGGRRPIGLLPTLVRVWEKLRKSVMDS